MKLQKLTEKRWFWPALCAVSVVFGWWYLSITTCAPLGGDDELINLQNYYYITHTSFGQSVLDYLGDLWVQFTLQNGRFRPFSSPPVRGLTSWFLGDLVGYRLYILAWTYADIVLTAWLVGKASRSKKLGIACLCLLPMMFSVWQPVFLRCAGAKHAAARPCGRAGRAALAGHRAQAVGRAGRVLRLPVLCHL